MVSVTSSPVTVPSAPGLKAKLRSSLPANLHSTLPFNKYKFPSFANTLYLLDVVSAEAVNASVAVCLTAPLVLSSLVLRKATWLPFSTTNMIWSLLLI